MSPFVPAHMNKKLLWTSAQTEREGGKGERKGGRGEMDGRERGERGREVQL